jgi:hypothetical protein
MPWPIAEKVDRGISVASKETREATGASATRGDSKKKLSSLSKYGRGPHL